MSDENPAETAPDAAPHAAVSAVIEKRIRLSCYVALAALVLVGWSQVQRNALLIVVAMSAGQAVGTLSLLLFLWAVRADLRRMLPHLRRGSAGGRRTR